MTNPTNRRRFLSQLAAGSAALGLSRLLPGAWSAAATSSAWASGMVLDITFTLATQVTGRFKRPYVAVWVEDASGNTLRTLTVWVSQGRQNPRWLAELRRWMRQNSELVSTVSSATRNAGTYAVAWDGKNDKGTLLPQGDYYLCVEAAREHGPYSLVREKLSIGTQAFQKALGQNNDIEAVHVRFAKA